YRTTRKRMGEYSQLREQSYHCCINSCMSYSMFPDAQECRVCGQSRWENPDAAKKKPRAQHTYIPLTVRLCRWWNQSARAKSMIDYRKHAIRDREQGLRTNFWSGDHYHDNPRRHFRQETDIALMFSTDAVKVFKSR
ncbi:hypothetical protein EDC01DRAFT_595491, partial [Geopyxis carbonaria]